MDAPQFYYYKNDNMLELNGLKDEITEEFVNDADVTASVKDSENVEVTGQTWPLTLDYITASDGIYRGVLEAALDVAVGDKLTVEVTVDGGVGREAFFAIPITVRQRGKVYF